MGDGQFREAESALDSTSSRKECPRHCQSLAGMEDVDSEKQKPLPFHFQTPCLQFTKDESKARIHWQAKRQRSCEAQAAHGKQRQQGEQNIAVFIMDA